ncbi:MAG TPA: F0F1 ATP synthase subunit I [Pseudohongiella sp.]|nr:F0F1 ATP synthase subunit I [Pseudohongiella sp.]|tara:strand:- start:78 stop:464 length:387 start_codon:yes stop_codon:yes gene_type:complete
MSTIKAPPIYKVAAFQLLFLLLISVLAAILAGWVSAYSLLIGGLISLIPGTLFASRVFKYRGARAAQMIAREVYRGEAIKWFLTGLGFALSFIYVEPLNVVALFSGFVLVHLAGVVVFVRLIRSPDNS